jgi:hypothetical protein
MPKTKAKAVTRLAADLIRAVTRTDEIRGEDGFGDPETRRFFLEAKRKEAERKEGESVNEGRHFMGLLRLGFCVLRMPHV